MNNDEHTLYFDLMKKYPDLFSGSDIYPIVKDLSTIVEYEKKTNKKIGVLYHSEYNMLIADLIKRDNGQFFVYERVIPTEGNAVIAIAVYENQLILLKQYRHAIRDYQYSFVRGYGSKNISAENNVKKEIYEEIGSSALSYTFLGKVLIDSGLTAAGAYVYLCEVTAPVVNGKNEGIEDLVFADKRKFENMIRQGNINDSLTLSAYQLYLAYKQKIK